ncbi:MAG: hypothetical protein ABFR89_02590 [Actinomycetota bacterium]
MNDEIRCSDCWQKCGIAPAVPWTFCDGEPVCLECIEAVEAAQRIDTR